MLAGCIIYITSIVVRHSILSVDFVDSPDEDFFHNWLARLIGEIGISISILCMIIIRIRSIRKEGLSIRKILYPSIGISFCIIFILISVIDYQAFKKTYSIISKPFSILELMELQINDKNLPIAARSKCSKMYAQNYYAIHGRIIKYLTPIGNMKKYEPTKEDEEMKRLQYIFVNHIKPIIKWKKIAVFYWAFVAFLGLIVGMFSPIHKY